MKKYICLLLSCLLVAALTIPALAATEQPEITMQPQSPTYEKWAVAQYTVKVNVTGLKATWRMEWLGKTYDLSKKGDWEAYAGETYGATTPDATTFSYFFGGIEEDLDGAYIWCELKGADKILTSQKVRISVGNNNPPPEILNIPTQLTVEKGDLAEIRCVAKSPDGSQLTFLWYETATGKMEDMTAVNRGEETADYLLCETDQVGTRNYLCKVGTEKGGISYSSIVAVTVTEKQTVAAPTVPAETAPEETQAPTVPAATIPAATESAPQPAERAQMPLWAMGLIALLAIGGGVGVALILTKK